MENAEEMQKLSYNRKAVETKFEKGDLIIAAAWVQFTKLNIHWIGPGKITYQQTKTKYNVTFPQRKHMFTC